MKNATNVTSIVMIKVVEPSFGGEAKALALYEQGICTATIPLMEGNYAYDVIDKEWLAALVGSLSTELEARLDVHFAEFEDEHRRPMLVAPKYNLRLPIEEADALLVEGALAHLNWQVEGLVELQGARKVALLIAALIHETGIIPQSSTQVPPRIVYR